jgi:toxin ParE1/3/4
MRNSTQQDHVGPPSDEVDLREIAAYTEREWGPSKRRAYLDALSSHIGALADNPSRGIARDDVQPGYRSSRVGRHVIFYRPVGTGIEVVRVLHEKMDIERHVRTTDDP